MRTTVIVFARLPRLGTVKQRLARDIGAVQALRFYRASLSRLERKLARDRRLRLIWNVTPDRAANRKVWRLAGGIEPQGRGDLGARMARALGRPRRGPVLIVGSDVPGVDGETVGGAISLLKRHDFVFGPSGDGGYWAVGFKNLRAAPPALFRTVRWSTDAALADTLATVPPGFSVAFADSQDDVDTGDDYARWKGADRES